MTNSAELLKLAQELNAVDIINSEDSRINRIRKPQVYKYLLSVDFEATCWRDKQYNTKHRSPEIIEFPAVLINLENGEILREFQQYVKPTENPILTDFCTELTGIRQDQVKSGISIQQCIVDFHMWLTELQEEYGLIFPKMSQENKTGNVAFVTYSDWDFGVCLARECGRKRLKKPSYFEQWIDLRAIYRAFYNYKSKNFADALNHVGLKFVGRQHSGLDDARNAARLCYKMKRDGAFFAITKDLNPYKEFNKPFELSSNRS